jgi:hypothetical protein
MSPPSAMVSTVSMASSRVATAKRLRSSERRGGT